MNVNIELSNNSQWTKSDNVYVSGSAFLDGKYLNDSQLCSLFTGSCKKKSRDLITKLNGFFSIIIMFDENELIVAVDRSQSKRICYYKSNDQFILSDDPYLISSKINAELDPKSTAEYTFFRFPLGNRTIFDNIDQVPPGGLIEVYGGEVEIQQHYEWSSQEKLSIEESKVHFQDAINNSFDRLVKKADGRMIVLPLSGGVDSRLVASMLVDRGYKNLFSYTLGIDSHDSIAARKAANKLDIPWKLINITHSDWHEFVRSPEWLEIKRSTAAPTGLPLIKDVVGYKKLCETTNIPSDAIFVPGHTAVDIVYDTPDSLFETDSVTKAEVAKEVFYDAKLDWRASTEFKQDMVEKISSKLPADPVEGFEFMRWRGRYTRHVGHHGKIFEYLGHDYWYPLHDNELYTYWERSPKKHKLNKFIHQKKTLELYKKLTDDNATEMKRYSDKNLQDKIEHKIIRSPIEQYVSQLYYFIQDLQRRRSDRMSKLYETNPNYGVFPSDGFSSVYQTGAGFQIKTYLLLEMINCINFDGEVLTVLPPNSEISLEWAEEHVQLLAASENRSELGCR